MNSFEPCFWMGALLVVLRLAEGSATPRAWLLFGLLAGLGIENKHTIVFFLVALLGGLLLSPQRRILWSKGCAAGVALLLLLALPNFLWQWVHHFPTYEFLNGVAHTDKNVKLPPVEFLVQQVKVLLVFSAPLWIGGLVWLAFARKARPWRFVALTYLLFLAMMMAMHAKNYYLAPIYPVLFAAGAVAFGQLTRRSWPPHRLHRGSCLRALLRHRPHGAHHPAAEQLHRLHRPLRPQQSQFRQILPARSRKSSPTASAGRRWSKALPPATTPFRPISAPTPPSSVATTAKPAPSTFSAPNTACPTAISGHQNYFYWGWNNYTGESVLTLGDHREDYTDTYAEVIDLGPFDAPWIMDHEHHHYFWLRHRKHTFAADWPEFKYWY